MKMSEEMAVRLHRMMWSDMQKELGDCPSCDDRLKFKFDWIHKHFPGESIANDCWLCEYASSMAWRKEGDPYCQYCPIKWPNCHCNTLGFSYAKDPISDILALPAKNKEIEAKHDETAVVRSYYNYREDLLSKASGLPASLAIEEHVKAIREKVIDELAKASGLPAANTVTDHISAVQAKASKEKVIETLRKTSMQLADKLDRYKDALSKESGLDRNRPVDDHIREIVKNSMEAGATEERDRIQEKIYEVLLS